MNEKQWAKERSNAQAMVYQLSDLGVPRTKAGRRKLRLYACGCSRLVWHLLMDERLKAAVELSERVAEGLANKAELPQQYSQVWQLGMGGFNPTDPGVHERTAAVMAIGGLSEQALAAALRVSMFPVALAGVSVGDRNGEAVLCDLLRCVFGNPFVKPAFPKAWRTEAVTALAAATYAERAFDRLPILADALEEAGCDHPAMLNHLRGPGPHCRGCWVMDLALGK